MVLDFKNDVDTAWIFQVKDVASCKRDIILTVAIEAKWYTMIWYRVTHEDTLVCNNIATH